MAGAGALALTLLSGCLGTYTGDPEARGPRNIEPRTRPDLANDTRGEDTQAWLLSYGRLDEIVVNVSAPVLVAGAPGSFVTPSAA